MIKKSILLLLLIMSVGIMQSQTLRELDSLSFRELVDTLLIDNNPNTYSFRLFTNYKVKEFRISNKDYKLTYVPNNRYGVGFGIANSKVLIDIAFNLKGNNKEVTERFDMQGSVVIARKNYVNFYVQNYNGFNVTNNFNNPSVFRDDINSVTIGFNALHIMPDVEFSYSMLKAGLDHLDKKVNITGGFGLFCFYDYFSADVDILPVDAEMFFNEEAHIKRYNSAAIGALGGVLATLKLPKDILFSCNIMPGIGGIYKHVTLRDDTYKPNKHILLKTDYTFALGYIFDPFYVSLIYGGGLYTTSLDYGNDYVFNLTKAKFAIGYKFWSRRKTSIKTRL